jgi:hypothetical protein
MSPLVDLASRDIVASRNARQCLAVYRRGDHLEPLGGAPPATPLPAQYLHSRPSLSLRTSITTSSWTSLTRSPPPGSSLNRSVTACQVSTAIVQLGATRDGIRHRSCCACTCGSNGGSISAQPGPRRRGRIRAGGRYTTLRQIVCPCIAGTKIRVRFSNAFGNRPIIIQGASLARAVAPPSTPPHLCLGALPVRLALSCRGALIVLRPSPDAYLAVQDMAVSLHFSRPGKPTDNAYIEAFNGRFRAECLNTHWFLTLAEPAKNWRSGADTTTRIGRMVPLATSPRSRW